jgi:cysteine protease ATG4
MCKPYFSGMLGGRPREANFITGFSDDKFIVLDPHLI